MLSEAADAAATEIASLFRAWRTFEAPPLRDGAPDYSEAAFARRRAGFRGLRKRLDAIDLAGAPVALRIDHAIIRAEMNGWDFNDRVLRPWARDPAFYQQVWTCRSDTPAHEGPVNHALLELWTYEFPLSDEAAARLGGELAGIPGFLRLARGNLTGDARDLWIAGAKSMADQAKALDELRRKIDPSRPALRAQVETAALATREFVDWLNAEAPKKKGPSGVGRENYTWMLQNVHLTPMTWEDEVMLLKRELARAHASLRLEEHRNRGVPELSVVGSAEAYEKRAKASVDKYIAFIEAQDILPLKDYLKPALMEQIGAYSPPETRNFFAEATHREPMTLYTHFYHWWDLARMREEPHESPVRREALLYNIWDSRAEGMATAMEEMMMHAGLYDDNPRVREVVWIMQAQRAARGLASLYAQANEIDMKAASAFHVKWTPRGWMSPSLDLLGFEQQLYLRQPGYGTSYVTGKHLIEQLFAERTRQAVEEEEGRDYSLKDFFAELNAAGLIPVSMIRWEMTGEEPEAGHSD